MITTKNLFQEKHLIFQNLAPNISSGAPGKSPEVQEVAKKTSEKNFEQAKSEVIKRCEKAKSLINENAGILNIDPNKINNFRARIATIEGTVNDPALTLTVAEITRFTANLDNAIKTLEQKIDQAPIQRIKLEEEVYQANRILTEQEKKMEAARKSILEKFNQPPVAQITPANVVQNTPTMTQPLPKSSESIETMGNS